MSHSSSTENISSSSLTSLVQSISTFKSVLTLYLIPASLYCLYNNLSFVSLQYFNPTTYFMFMQIRLLLTGVIYQVKVIAIVLHRSVTRDLWQINSLQILFKRSLSSKQWLSLLILTVGCMIHAGGTEVNSDEDDTS